VTSQPAFATTVVKSNGDWGAFAAIVVKTSGGQQASETVVLKPVMQRHVLNSALLVLLGAKFDRSCAYMAELCDFMSRAKVRCVKSAEQTLLGPP